MTTTTTTTTTARAKHAGRKRLPNHGDYRRFNLLADSFLLFVLEQLAEENGISVSRCINDVLAYGVENLENLPFASTYGDFPAVGGVFL